MRIKKLDFFNSLLLKERMSMFYSHVANSFSSKLLVESSHYKNKIEDIVIIKDVPGYLSPKPYTSSAIAIANMYKGYCIHLGKYPDFQTYLLTKLSAKRRSNHKTLEKRLTICFNARHKMYFGAIQIEEYNYLFGQLRLMIEKRFDSKKMHHSGRKKMDDYQKIIYPKILEKKATIFVIYHSEKPISISINLIEGDIYLGFIMAFDMDYSKFYPGIINIHKQIEWCFQKKIQLFDMMKGDLSYKNIFADKEYLYQSHVRFSSHNVLAFLASKILIFKINLYYRILDFSKKIGLHLWYRKIKGYIYSIQQKRKPISTISKFTIKKITDKYPTTNLLRIDINNQDYNYLRRSIYDTLYASKENAKDIEVFRIKEETFLVKGKRNNILLSPNP